MICRELQFLSVSSPSLSTQQYSFYLVFSISPRNSAVLFVLRRLCLDLCSVSDACCNHKIFSFLTHHHHHLHYKRELTSLPKSLVLPHSMRACRGLFGVPSSVCLKLHPLLLPPFSVFSSSSSVTVTDD